MTDTDRRPRPAPLEGQVAELQAERRRARALFEEAPVAYFLLDGRGQVEEANGLACALLGRSRDDLRGHPFGSLLDPASEPEFAALLERALENPERQRGLVHLLRSDGTPCAVLLDLVASGEGGGPGRCRLTATDITTQWEAHRTLMGANTDLDRQLQERTARISALNEELEHVITTFTRQLHLPLGRAMGALGMLRRALGEGPDPVLRPALHIERAVQQIVALLQSMERYMQARRMNVRLRPVNLEAVLREVLKDSRDLLADRNVQITHDPLPTVQGDSQVLTIILTEYISNALKFTRTRQEARLHVLSRETETEYHIGVQDNGVGFDPRGQDRLFRLFGRQHSSKEFEGSGLGLAVVCRTVESCGGRAWGEGRPGEGATFWVAWPRQPRVIE